MIDILQFCKWFSRMTDCSWNSTVLLNQIWFFPHKTAQFEVIFHNNINNPGSFSLSPLGPQNRCFTSRLSSNFQAGRIRREITMKKGVVLKKKKNWNLHRNFPFITFTYILVAETVSDSLHIAKESRKYSSPTGRIVSLLCCAWSLSTVWLSWDPWTRHLCPWDSLGKNTGVGCHSLLQGIFPTQR